MMLGFTPVCSHTPLHPPTSSFDSNNNGVDSATANPAAELTQMNPTGFSLEGTSPFLAPSPQPSPSAKMAVSTGRLGSAINSMVLVTPSVQQNGNFLHSLENLIESGDVAELAKTKQGCFLLQQNVPLCDQRLRAKLYNAFLQKDVFYTLCGDPSGNFFMQKLMDRSSPVEHPVIVSLVQGYLTALSCNRYSTRVMQKLWLKLNDELRMVLLDELKGREIDIAVDPNGTHLIQRIIEGAPISIYGPIVETFVSTNVRLRTIAEGRSGRRIVQLVFQKLGNDILLPHSEDAKALLEKLMQGMMLNFEQFVNHQFANYVIQYIISAQVFTRYTTEAIKKLFGKLLILSQEKYASHVVERALEFGNTKVVGAIMDEIFNGYEHDSDGADALEILLFDQFGNYVVQKMFEIAIDVRVGKRDGSTYWFDVLAQRIHQRYHQLRKYSSGLRLIDRLASATELLIAQDSNYNVVAEELFDLFRSESSAESLRSPFICCF